MMRGSLGRAGPRPERARAPGRPSRPSAARVARRLPREGAAVVVAALLLCALLPLARTLSPLQGAGAARAQAQGCSLRVQRDLPAASVDRGALLTVALRAEPEPGCAGFRLPPRAVLVIQPPRAEGDLESWRALAHAVLSDLEARGARVGLLVAGERQPSAAVPGESPEAIRQRIEGLRAAGEARPAWSAERALREALALLPPAPEHQDQLLFLAHPDAPAAEPEALEARVAEASARDAALVALCPGRPCPDALSWDWPPEQGDAIALAGAIDAGWLRAHDGPVWAVEGLALEETLHRAVAYQEDSAEPPAMVTTPRLRWERPLAPGASFAVRYRLAVDGWGRLAPAEGRATWRLSGPGGATRWVTGTVEGGSVLVRYAPPPGGPPCETAAARTIAPPRVPLGDPVTVRLHARGACRADAPPIDAALVLDVSGSMDPPRIAGTRAAALAFLDRLEALPARVGLLTFDGDPRAQLALSADFRSVRDAAAAIASTGGETDLPGALLATRALFEARRAGAAGLAILVSDGQHQDLVRLEAAADALKGDGVQVIAICPAGRCDELALRRASSGVGFFAEAGTPDEIAAILEGVARDLARVPLRQARFQEWPSANVAALPGTGAPVPERIGRDLLRWVEPVTSSGRITVSHRIEPLHLGVQPSLRFGRVIWTDLLGREGAIELSDPGVETYLPPDRGPCTMLASAAVDPTGPVRAGEPVTAELRVRLDCPEPPPVLDVILAVDHSGSMGSLGRLEGAQRAVAAFLNSLDEGDVRVGLVAFSTDVTVRLAPATDFAPLREAVDRLRPEGQTAIVQALRAADELLGPQDPQRSTAVVLLTDGEDSSGSERALLDAAHALHDRGADLVTVCAGECDAILPSLASRPDYAFDVAEAEDLTDLFRDLAARLSEDSDLRNVVLRLGVSSSLPLVPGSAAPPFAEETWHEGRWPLALDEVEGSGVTRRVALRPAHGGRLPLARFARVDYGFGPSERNAGAAYVPLPELQVLGGAPTATATPGLPPTPSATPTLIATRTPSPLPSPTPGPVGRTWLPWAGAGESRP